MSPVERLERIVGIITRAQAKAGTPFWWPQVTDADAQELERLARGIERRVSDRRAKP